MLSVGQRQLLAFIRAYVHRPRIPVLDEATSSVDTMSEHLIQEATERITRDRTSIVIAHRLSTIQNADRILVLDKGKIRNKVPIRSCWLGTVPTSGSTISSSAERQAAQTPGTTSRSRLAPQIPAMEHRYLVFSPSS